jgi:hypothetical protein
MWQFDRAATSIGCFHGPLADKLRRGRCEDDRPTVKAQGMATAITTFGKVFAVGKLPFDIRCIDRHRSLNFLDAKLSTW